MDLMIIEASYKLITIVVLLVNVFEHFHRHRTFQYMF